MLIANCLLPTLRSGLELSGPAAEAAKSRVCRLPFSDRPNALAVNLRPDLGDVGVTTNSYNERMNYAPIPFRRAWSPAVSPVLSRSSGKKE